MRIVEHTLKITCGCGNHIILRGTTRQIEEQDKKCGWKCIAGIDFCPECLNKVPLWTRNSMQKN